MTNKFIPPQYNVIYRDEKYWVSAIDWQVERVFIRSSKGGTFVADFKDVEFKQIRRKRKNYEPKNDKTSI